MRGIRKILMLIIVITLIPTLSGCNNKKESNSGYVEKTLSLPTNTTNVFDMREVTDKKISIVVEDNDSNLVTYVSTSGGNVWDKENTINLNDCYGDSVKVSNVLILNNGKLLVYTDDKKIHIMDKNNEINELDLEKINCDITEDMKLSNDDILFIKSTDEKQIIKIDINNISNVKVFNVGTQIEDWTVNDNLIVSTNGKIYIYNIDNMKKKNEKVEISKYFSDKGHFFKSKSEISYLSYKGIYRYDIGTKKEKKIVDTSSTYFENREESLITIIERNDKEYLACFCDNDLNYHLVSYKFKKNITKDDKNSITVYSLYPNEQISQSIVNFQKDNKDIKIKYENGIDRDYSISETDAIKRINTEIASGNGPDIIVLDGLPIESYIKKGLLKNINSIIDKHSNELFQNVVESNKEGNKTYKIPLSISFNYILGENIDNINNLQLFSNGINSDNSKKVLNIYEPKELIESLYYSCSSSWIDDGRNINEEKIKEFLVSCKKIYDINRKNITDEQLNKHRDGLENFQKNRAYFLNFSNYGDILLKDVSRYSISNISSIHDIFFINEIIKRNSNIKYSKWQGQIGEYYIPNTQVAITTTSKNENLSKKFISSLLDYEYQLNLHIGGIPVNKKACLDKLDTTGMSNMAITFGDTFNSMDDSNQFELTDVNSLTEEEAKKYISDIDLLKIQVNTDTTPLILVEDEMEKFILGQVDLNKTMDNIKSKLSVWLSE